ncbi:hypothetical protein PQX77_000842 [Marasmius sp. AFHP31]|nr:hypothetical protein PQX77_000842 [Marasmius sp. AFHP31]
MEEMLRALRDFYYQVESPIDKILEHDTYSGIHEELKKLFLSARDFALTNVTYLDKLQDRAGAKPRQRQRGFVVQGNRERKGR